MQLSEMHAQNNQISGIIPQFENGQNRGKNSRVGLNNPN